MSLYRKTVFIGYCGECGHYGVPMEEKVYDPSSGKNYFVCRDCFTVLPESQLNEVIEVSGLEWSKKHPVKDHILHTPKLGGK